MKAKKTVTKKGNNDTERQLSVINAVLTKEKTLKTLSKNERNLRIKEIEALSIKEFSKLNRAKKIQLLLEYASHKQVLFLTASRYYLTNHNDHRLDKENFEGLLTETAIKTVNSYESSLKKKIGTKELKDNFDSVRKILGYFTNAYKKNVKKNFVPLTTAKRSNAVMQSLNPVNHMSDGSFNFDIQDKKFDIDSFENLNTFKKIDKILKEYDSANKTQLSSVFQELLNNEFHAEVAKKFKYTNHLLGKEIKKIKDIVSSYGLLPNFEQALRSVILSSESLEPIQDFKIEEKISNTNFMPSKKIDCTHVISENYKTNKKEITFIITDENKSQYQNKKVVLDKIQIDFPQNLSENELTALIGSRKKEFMSKWI